MSVLSANRRLKSNRAPREFTFPKYRLHNQVGKSRAWFNYQALYAVPFDD